MNNKGRPPIFKTAEELQSKIDEYFESRKQETTGYDNKGMPVTKMNPPSLTGLALYLGFESRQSIYDYEKNTDFSYTIKRARLKCENFIEEGLYGGEIPPAAGIFALKNFGWSDRHDIDVPSGLKFTLNIGGEADSDNS
jgi:hypothetical protein